MENRPEVWKLFSIAKEFGQLPSDVLFLKEGDNLGAWELYQLNAAVFAFGRFVENELAENTQKKKGNRKDPKQVLQKLLYPDSQPAYASLGKRAQAVRIKPGDDPIEALLKGVSHERE